MPTNSHDSLVFAVTSNNTNDHKWWYGEAEIGAIFGNVALPKASQGLLLDGVGRVRAECR